MSNSDLNVVTGAFGFSGRCIARRLLSQGKRVLTLTGRTTPDDEFGSQVPFAPWNFDNPSELTRSLEGATVLYNTYWIRFPYGDITFEKAVENSRVLIKAAVDAGVKRIVHISITNPSEDSPYPYFRGKALVEKAIGDSGLSFGILRPAVIFGDQGILINNITWLLRHFPFFVIPGVGQYELQPIFVDDLAGLAVTLGEQNNDVIVDAIGAESYTFESLVYAIARTIHSYAWIFYLPPGIVYTLTRVLSRFLGDVVLTQDEISGLMDDLLISTQPPNGQTRLSDWLTQNRTWLGRRYMSELKKHYRG